MLSSFEKKTGHTGAMISAVDLLKGIAVGAQMKVVEVEGANGGLHTNYEGKADAAVEALLKEGFDFAYVHLEAPDEMGHQGSCERKVQAIENLDQRIIKRIISQLEAAGTDFRMLVLPDHPTPVAIRTHVSDPVPYMLYDSTDRQHHNWNYNEKDAEASGNYIATGHTIINHLFEK
jgi:2,3-bisphosphoglycerate-independent phosphoglycerate mutase